MALDVIPTLNFGHLTSQYTCNQISTSNDVGGQLSTNVVLLIDHILFAYLVAVQIACSIFNTFSFKAQTLKYSPFMIGVMTCEIIKNTGLIAL